MFMTSFSSGFWAYEKHAKSGLTVLVRVSSRRSADVGSVCLIHSIQRVVSKLGTRSYEMLHQVQPLVSHALPPVLSFATLKMSQRAAVTASMTSTLPPPAPE